MDNPNATTTPLTADAIHNWDVPYIQQQYAGLPPAIQADVRAAMRRHHQQGTDAHEEATALNARWGLNTAPARP